MNYLFILILWAWIFLVYPILGAYLIIPVVIFIFKMRKEDKKQKEIRDAQKEYKIWRQQEKLKKQKEREKEISISRKKEKEMSLLLDKLLNEFKHIIEKDFKVVSNAYRKSVITNDFGKKNYDKFLPQLIEYLQDKSKILHRLEQEFDTVASFDFSADVLDNYIEIIETKIKESDSTFDYSDDMDPYDYEHLCAEEFKKNKWDAEATQGSSDQGVDVIAKKDARTLVAQCKRFMKPVGNKAVQEIVAGMKYYEATEGVVIAPNGFTNSAKNLAEANNIKLIHHSEINDL
jgi:restriction system protein